MEAELDKRNLKPPHEKKALIAPLLYDYFSGTDRKVIAEKISDHQKLIS